MASLNQNSRSSVSDATDSCNDATRHTPSTRRPARQLTRSWMCRLRFEPVTRRPWAAAPCWYVAARAGRLTALVSAQLTGLQHRAT